MPDDLPAADADMLDRREDSDLSASALQKISDIVTRQVSLAMNSMNRRAPVPVPVTPHGGRYDCHGFRQSGTDCVYATDSMPSCGICLPASVGGRIQSTFNIINAADFDVTTSFRSGRFFLRSVTVSLCLPSPFLYGDVWGCPLLSGILEPIQSVNSAPQACPCNQFNQSTARHKHNYVRVTNPISQQRATSMSV